LPGDEEKDKFAATQVCGVTVYYSQKLAERQGDKVIHIYLKRFLWWKWLEQKGAQGVAVLNE